MRVGGKNFQKTKRALHYIWNSRVSQLIAKLARERKPHLVTRSDGVVVILAQFQIGKPVLIVETWRSFIFINFLILEYLHYGRNFHICAKNFEAIFHTKYVLYLCHYNPHLANAVTLSLFSGNFSSNNHLFGIQFLGFSTIIPTSELSSKGISQR